MMTIRKAQLKTMQQTLVNDFERTIEQLLNVHFNSRYRQLTTKQVKRFIHQSLEKAKSKGIIRQQSVCKYIIILFIFDYFFEDHLKLPWNYQLTQDQVSDMDVYQAYESVIVGLKAQYPEV